MHMHNERQTCDGDEINLHLPQGVHVTAELQTIMSVSEKIVTGQSGSPVVKLIQDAVVGRGLSWPKTKPTHSPTAFWLTQLDPSTHAPRSLGVVTFSQVALDLPDPGILSRILQLRGTWNAFRCAHPDHPTVRALAAAGVDYATTGFAVLSLCIPPTCCFTGRAANNTRLLTMYRKARHLPAHTLPVTVHNGLFLGGVVTRDTLMGALGLLGHIYHHHGPAAGLRFIDAMQRLTTSVSMYA